MDCARITRSKFETFAREIGYPLSDLPAVADEANNDLLVVTECEIKSMHFRMFGYKVDVPDPKIIVHSFLPPSIFSTGLYETDDKSLMISVGMLHMLIQEIRPNRVIFIGSQPLFLYEKHLPAYLQSPLFKKISSKFDCLLGNSYDKRFYCISESSVMFQKPEDSKVIQAENIIPDKVNLMLVKNETIHGQRKFRLLSEAFGEAIQNMSVDGIITIAKAFQKEVAHMDSLRKGKCGTGHHLMKSTAHAMENCRKAREGKLVKAVIRKLQAYANDCVNIKNELQGKWAYSQTLGVSFFANKYKEVEDITEQAKYYLDGVLRNLDNVKDASAMEAIQTSGKNILDSITDCNGKIIMEAEHHGINLFELLFY
ncbi:hypothetical protein [Fibrobacter sp. UWH1]|uniref:hypothetical protein n=1 Tax=Fibrobacter sp. UWH1 TaxID=1964354 RepID=UPI000B70674C|nr:hypothetical protein [Fibrobacter sp. UWH1]OWV15572.1 hypothetical protein B7992_04090 [Fibrobacter sp. UWH1]